MSKTIKKLNKLNNLESFIQIDTIKGFKYIDRAGEIVNTYYKKILHCIYHGAKWSSNRATKK